jgi:hypothetical protein
VYIDLRQQRCAHIESGYAGVWAYDGYGVSVLLAGRGGARGRGGGRRQHRRVEGLHTQTQINDEMSEGEAVQRCELVVLS